MKNIRHIGIVVEDLDKMLEFYCGVLGMKVAKEAVEDGTYIEKLIGLESAVVRTVKLAADDGCTLIELLKFEGAIERVQPKKLYHTGITHIAVTVEDVDAVYKKIVAKGLTPNSPPVTSPDSYARLFFVQDPEGNYLELVEVLKK